MFIKLLEKKKIGPFCHENCTSNPHGCCLLFCSQKLVKYLRSTWYTDFIWNFDLWMLDLLSFNTEVKIICSFRVRTMSLLSTFAYKNAAVYYGAIRIIRREWVRRFDSTGPRSGQFWALEEGKCLSNTNTLQHSIWMQFQSSRHYLRVFVHWSVDNEWKYLNLVWHCNS